MCKAWEDHRKSGLEEGRIEGEIQGRLSLLQDLVKDGTLTIEAAAAKANMTVDEYKKHLNNS